MGIEEIKKLRPTFRFGNTTMIDWFEVHEGNGYCSIRSGLKHADCETKSLYHYDYFEGGKHATKNVLNHFNNWWKNLTGEIRDNDINDKFEEHRKKVIREQQKLMPYGRR